MMIKSVCSLLFGLFFCANISSQITVPLSTLPDVGDQLRYQSIPTDTTATRVNNQVFQTGANLQWDFANLDAGTETSENYNAITAGTIADSFPDANIAVDFIGFQGYAKRNTTDISIIGVTGDNVAGLPLPILGKLNNPFIIRRAPFGYEDQFSANTTFNISIDASGLDSIAQFQELAGQIPGATIDSVRITLAIDRSENLDGWGVLTVPSGDVSVLKMTQTDIVTTTIEAYAVTLFGSAWVDVSPFLPAETNDLLTASTTNHLFFGADQKEVVAEFTMDPDSTLLSTRYARDITSSIFQNYRFINLIDVAVYPNPTSDVVSVNIDPELLKDNLIIRIHDISGRLIKSQIISQSISEVGLTNFKSGIQTLSVYSDQKLVYRNLLMVSKSN